MAPRVFLAIKNSRAGGADENLDLVGQEVVHCIPMKNE